MRSQELLSEEANLNSCAGPAKGAGRVRQAQIKRWAALKSASKANMNATVAPLPKVKKKAAKAA